MDENFQPKFRIRNNIYFYIGLFCVIFVIILFIYWYYIRPNHYEKIYQKLKKFKGFKYSHLTNQPDGLPQTQPQPVSNTNCHMLIYGTSGSGKTSFLKFYLDQTRSDFIVFGRDETEFRDKYIPLLQLEKFEIEKLANKTIILDDAGAYKNLKLKVEDLFRFGRHHNIQVIYLAHYAKDVLPIVRENCFKLFITINNPDSFFDTLTNTYSIKDLKWQQYRDQLEFGIIEYDTRSRKYKILNDKYKVIYDTTKNKWSPEDYVCYESYFFTGDDYNRLKIFLEEMSDQTIEITPENIAFYYVEYCKQNKIKVNESKIDNYIERMQKPLISDKPKEEFKNIILSQAIRFSKSN